MIHEVQNTFHAGELSPYVLARPELEVYRAGCSRMENFIALPYGGARYRPGTELLGGTKSNGAAVLYGFEFSTSERHVLEFGPLYVRFWKTGTDTAELIESGGSPVEEVTPYEAEELRNLQFAQLNDVVFITHPNHPPQRLSRFAEDDWTMEEFPFLHPPLLDAETSTSLAITASATTGTGITLTASGNVFDSGHVGAVFELAYRRAQEEIAVELDIVSGGSTTVNVKNVRTSGTTARNNLETSTTIRVDGSFTIQTFGTWSANVEVFRRYLGQTDWEEYLLFTGKNDRNVNEAFTVDEPAELMIVVDDGPFSSATNARAIVSVSDPYIRGLVEVTAVASATSATADVVTQLASGTATTFSEAAFSDFRGYPRAVTFHGQRLWFGGTVSRPQTVWASRIDAYDDFARPFATDNSVDDDSSLTLPVFAEQHNRIEWLSSNRALLAGTSAGEFVITGRADEESVTATDFLIRRHTSNGSGEYQALPVDSAVVFIQRQGRRLRKMGYRFENDSYEADDATIYSEHLTRGNLVELALQRQREAIIWGITEDGKMIGWTYRPDQPFFAAYELTSPGMLFESVATVYGDGDEDETWIVVNRGGTRYVERFRPGQILAQETNNLNALWFLDSAVEFTSPTATCTGLGHLEGVEVAILADGGYVGTATVASGQITNPRPLATRTLVGVHYGGELQTMPIEMQTENGTSQGRMKSTGRGLVRLFKSLTGEWFTAQNGQANEVRSLTPAQSLVEPRDLRDFDEVLESHPGESRLLSIGIRQPYPFPMTVLALSARVMLFEDE